mmetsp:Transcript_25/g.42  ORF Transcript_25/g.42 Transcript_25/m.42 type:complete len:90 (-) Transcript_25:304-573(-)
MTCDHISTLVLVSLHHFEVSSGDTIGTTLGDTTRLVLAVGDAHSSQLRDWVFFPLLFPLLLLLLWLLFFFALLGGAVFHSSASLSLSLS